MFPIICYAEIHHKRGIVPNFLWQHEPEIIADFPRRVDSDIKKIPFAIIVKDADKYPVVLKSVVIKFLFPQEKAVIPVFEGEEVITDRLWTKLFHISRIWPYTGDIPTIVEITYYCNKKQRIVENHNYRSIRPQLWYLHFASEPRPSIEGWYGGDIHWHSSYTDDDIEFGLTPAAAKELAYASGLSFLGVTDHSYDLDDITGQPHVKDPETKKWTALKKELFALNEASVDCALLRGEEVSCGNEKGKNVHALVFGHDEFIPGTGDSTDRGLLNKPDNYITGFKDKGFCVAAHPLDAQSALQRLILRRGVWSDNDLEHADAIEFYNGFKDAAFYEGKKAWIRMLLKGNKLIAVAGSDAHGDFASAFKVSIPFFTIRVCNQQITGTARTYVLCKKQPNEVLVMDALKKGRVIISDGPLCDMTIAMHHTEYRIGDTILPGKGTITINTVSSNEFGIITKTRLLCGKNGVESVLWEITPHTLTINEIINYTAESSTYIRLETETDTGAIAYGNPVWVK